MLVTASLVIITIDYKERDNGPLARAGSAALSIVAPLQQGVTKIVHPVAAFFSAVAHLPSLEEENRSLRSQVQTLKEQGEENGSLQTKVDEAYRLLDVRATLFRKLPTVGATVISSGISNFEWSIGIDKGSKDGLEVGMTVVAAEGLVGRVSQVGLTGSRVQLLVDPDFGVAARLAASGRSGLLRGRGRGDLELSFVGTRTPVEVGEPLVTAGYSLPNGESGAYPPDIPIGSVSSVTEHPGGTEQDITVQPNVDFSTLDLVLVVTATGNR